MDKLFLWRVGYFFIVFITAADAACPNTAGVVLGSIFGTLAVVAIVLAIVALLWRRRKKTGTNLSPCRTFQ